MNDLIIQMLLVGKSIYKDCVIYGPYFDPRDKRDYIKIHYIDKICQTSYARFIMECYLDNYLETDVDVHYKDNNKLNNSLSNLEILKIETHKELHVKRLQDQIKECGVCKETFIWTIKNQRNHQNRLKFGIRKCSLIFCSISCSNKFHKGKKNG